MSAGLTPEMRPACPTDTGRMLCSFSVSIKNVTDIKEIRFAIGEYTTVSQIKEAEGNLTLSAALAANYIVDGVFTYDVAYEGRYTFCIRHNDGTNDFLYVDVNDINTYLESDGLRLTVKDMKAASAIKDMWIAEGRWTTYSEIKNNVAAGAKYQATSTKLANYFATNDFTYTTANPGEHTVLIRYNDGTTEVHYITLTVDVPTFSQNGLQLTIGNIPGVKIIRSAYGHYNSIAEIKKAPLLRCFNNKTAIKDAETYMIQYREAGEITVIVEYNTGYKHIEQVSIQKKEPTFVQNGDKVTFGNLDGLVLIRYAKGEYTTAAQIKNAPGSVVIKPDAIADGYITVSDLEDGGIYTFCVQYDDESCYLCSIAAKLLPTRILCWGDSLSNGYPYELRSIVGIQTKNYAVGADTAEHVAMKMGAIPVYVAPFTIPASKDDVKIELLDEKHQPIASLGYYGTGGLSPVTVNGVEGALYNRDDGCYYFKRMDLSPYEEVEVRDYTRVITQGMKDQRSNDIHIIFNGTDDSYSSGEAYKLIEVQKKMIDHIGTDRYIVIGLTCLEYFPNIADFNADMSREYGEHFLDFRSYVLERGMADAGITPTSQDIADITAGEIPTSLRIDEIHGNDAFDKLLAQQVYNKLIELGLL